MNYFVSLFLRVVGFISTTGEMNCAIIMLQLSLFRFGMFGHSILAKVQNTAGSTVSDRQ